MTNKPKVDNKWVEKKKEFLDLFHSFEYEGKETIPTQYVEPMWKWIIAFITQTQQETLEMVRSYVDGVRNPYEMPDTQKQKHAFETARYDVLSFLNDRIVKTIKKKMEDKR